MAGVRHAKNLQSSMADVPCISESSRMEAALSTSQSPMAGVKAVPESQGRDVRAVLLAHSTGCHFLPVPHGGGRSPFSVIRARCSR